MIETTETKICTKCGNELPVDTGFYKRKDGYVLTVCKLCENRRISAWNKVNPDRRAKVVKRFAQKESTKKYRREWGLQKRFGITQEQYDLLLEKQARKCAICQKIRLLVVDHCHTTGKVRGLLCGSCNRAIGLLKDSSESAQRAASYLKTGA
jgi:predicted Fe-S protein YdhL (DUF1289 family)